MNEHTVTEAELARMREALKQRGIEVRRADVDGAWDVYLRGTCVGCASGRDEAAVIGITMRTYADIDQLNDGTPPRSH